MADTARHIATDRVREEMKQILSKSNYSITLNLGDWKDNMYRNNDTLNEFRGEPEPLGVTPFVYTFEDDRLKWGITYTFHGVRNNVIGYSVNGKALKYGRCLEFDRLYYILVNGFNAGVDFVQTYLNNVAPYRLGDSMHSVISKGFELFKETALGEALQAEELLNSIDESYLTKKGEYDKRRRINGMTVQKAIEEAENKLNNFYNNDYSSLTESGNSWYNEGEELAQMLRQDFAECMATGLVPLYFKNSAYTKKRKYKLGLNLHEFVATEQFVNSIRFKVKIRNG